MTDERRDEPRPFVPLPGTPGWDPALTPRRDRRPAQPMSTGSKVGIAVAVVFVIAGLAMLAFIVFIFAAFSSFGSNK